MEAIRGTAQPQLHRMVLVVGALAAALVLIMSVFAVRAWTSSSVVGTTAPAVHHLTLTAPASLPDRSDTQGPSRTSQVDVGCQLARAGQGRIAC